MASKVLKITFGIELQFLLLVRTSSKTDTADYGVDHVNQLLASDVVGRCSLPGCTACHTTVLRLQMRGQTVNQDGWSVVNRETVALTTDESKLMPKGWSVFGLAVKSPMLRYVSNTPVAEDEESLDDDHEPSFSAEWELSQVLRKLQVFAASGNTDHVLLTNETCGLHVLIGSKSHGFPLATVKNALGLMTAFERQFDSIHSLTRIQESVLSQKAVTVRSSLKDVVTLDSKWARQCLPLSLAHSSRAYKSRQNDHCPEARVLNMSVYPFRDESMHNLVSKMEVQSWYALIQGSGSIQDLVDLLGGKSSQNFTVNIFGFKPASNKSIDAKTTMNFQQHAATFSAAQVMAWVHATVSLVHYAHQSSSQVCSDLVADKWVDSAFCLPEILTTFGANEQTVAYYSKLLQVKNRNTAKPPATYYLDKSVEVMMQCIQEKQQWYNDRDEIIDRLREKMRRGGYGDFPSGSEAIFSTPTANNKARDSLQPNIKPTEDVKDKAKEPDLPLPPPISDSKKKRLNKKKAAYNAARLPAGARMPVGAPPVCVANLTSSESNNSTLTSLAATPPTASSTQTAASLADSEDSTNSPQPPSKQLQCDENPIPEPSLPDLPSSKQKKKRNNKSKAGPSTARMPIGAAELERN